MNGEPTNVRFVWIALTVLVVAIAAYAGMVIAQRSLGTSPETPEEAPAGD